MRLSLPPVLRLLAPDEPPPLRPLTAPDFLLRHHFPPLPLNLNVSADVPTLETL